jgi:hypothetical protein
MNLININPHLNLKEETLFYKEQREGSMNNITLFNKILKQVDRN